LTGKIDRKLFLTIKPINFKARDGRTTHGYLPLPNDTASHAPLVVTVHGGVLDYLGSNSIAQLLNSHGFGIMQINYRSSGGYVREFELSGNKIWASDAR